MFSRRLWGTFFFAFSPGGAFCLLQLGIPPLSVFNGVEVVPSPFFAKLYRLWPRGMLNKEVVMAMLHQWELHVFVHATYEQLMTDVLSLIDLGGELCGSAGFGHWFIVYSAGLVLTSEGEPRNQVGSEMKKSLRNWLVDSSWDLARRPRSPDSFLRDIGRLVEHNIVAAVIGVWDGPVVCRGSSGIISTMTGCSIALAVHSLLSGKMAKEPSLTVLAALRIWCAASVYRRLHNDWMMGKTENLQGHVFGLLYGAAICRFI